MNVERKGCQKRTAAIIKTGSKGSETVALMDMSLLMISWTENGKAERLKVKMLNCGLLGSTDFPQSFQLHQRINE
jgi:hypothetical protein